MSDNFKTCSDAGSECSETGTCCCTIDTYSDYGGNSDANTEYNVAYTDYEDFLVPYSETRSDAGVEYSETSSSGCTIYSDYGGNSGAPSVYNVAPAACAYPALHCDVDAPSFDILGESEETELLSSGSDEISN